MFSLKISVTLPADPDSVFRALTNAKAIQAWSGQSGKVSATIGGKFEYFDGWVTGRVLAYAPGKKLVHTWLPSDWPKDAQATIVQVDLARSDNGTKVTLRHKGFSSKRECEKHKQGWQEFVFGPIKDHFDSHQ